MIIKYGISNNNIDVTEICFDKLLINNVLKIPSGETNREYWFTDPLPGILKKIFILNNDNILEEYDDTIEIHYNIVDNSLVLLSNNDIANNLLNIQSKLRINHGDFNEEIPEQKMVVRYLTGNEKVLEIGGNIGRNTLVIASILKENMCNLVSLESDSDIANQLIENRQLNNYNFNVENSALSARKLIQKGWDTIESNILLPGYKPVKIITLEELNNKYNIVFDTLVLDCEGAFYYILMDMPEILNTINLIIMENDYYDINKKNYVDIILMRNSFYRDYGERGGWGPCENTFFEVWKKR